MKANYAFISVLLVAFFSIIKLNAQVVVSGSTGADGIYTSLTLANDAFDKINLSDQTGNTILITINANTTETGLKTLKAGNWKSITIYPTVTGCTIGGNVNLPLLTLDGADNVLIDGRLNGAGDSRDLTISNESGTVKTTAATIQFTNDAQNNTVKYCNIVGSATGGSTSTTPSGIITFMNAVTVTGNGNNLITNNSITSSAAGRVSCCVFGGGSVGFPNIGNTISNNIFYDHFLRAANASAITLTSNNNAWTISGNSFYETTQFASTTGTPQYLVINILGGNGYNISDNYMGGNAAKCSGMLTKLNSSNNIFTGISLAGTVGATSKIQTNTITNILWENNGKATWTGIAVSGAGDVNIVDNTVGANTGTSAITYSGTVTAALVYGINITATGTISCERNSIGSITANNVSTNSVSINGIAKSASAGITVISNNLVGSLTTPMSINSTNNTLSQNVNGINNAGTGQVTISGNTIANISNGTTGGELQGIKISAAGINTVNGNFIHSFSLPNSISASMYGITITPAPTTIDASTFSNNIIALDGNTMTKIHGIAALVNPNSTINGNNKLYHNTVYIGGVPTSGNLNSYAFLSTETANTLVLKNNLFMNLRSNFDKDVSGTHYAVSYASPTGLSLTPDYNDYYVTGAGGMLSSVNLVDINDLSTLQTTLYGGDAHSKTINPLLKNAGGTLPTDYASSVTVTNFSGTSTSVSQDFGGLNRNATSPRIGAYEDGWSNSSIFEVKNQNVQIQTTDTGIYINLDIDAHIELYGINGLLIDRTNASSTYYRNLDKGVYIVCINGQAIKIVK